MRLSAPMAAALAELPDETRISVIVGSGDMRLADLRAALGKESKRYLTTTEAADTFGYSASQWLKWAKDGSIRGAWQDDGSGSIWRLPAEACEEHLDRVRQGVKTARRRNGRPWAKDLSNEEVEVLQDRPEAVRQGSDDDEGPQRIRVARGRGED